MAMMFGLGILLIAGFTPVPSKAAQHQPDKLTLMRAVYLEAEAALDRRAASKAIKHFISRLDDYPLTVYLQHRLLERNFERTSSDAVEEFLSSHADFPLAGRLRAQLIERYQKQKAWRRLVTVYNSDAGTKARCYWLQARLTLGETATDIEDIAKVWLSARSRPSACDPVLAAWISTGGLTDELAWDRMALAIRAGQAGLAKYLRRYLSPKDGALSALWLRTRRTPIAILEVSNMAISPQRRDAVILYALSREARRKNGRPDRLLAKIEQRTKGSGMTLSGPTMALAARTIGMDYARAHDPAATTWLARVTPAQMDEDARGWLALSAARHGDWPLALRALKGFAQTPKARDPRWMYWTARALRATGQDTAAERLYAELAKERGYYSFLAADQLGSKYQFNDQVVTPAESEIARLERMPGLRRAKEFFTLERTVAARREWNYALRDTSPQVRSVAAKLAQNWTWQSQAVLTAGRSAHRDDLQQRFPLAYRATLLRETKKRGVDLSWAYAVIRQESAFMADIGSSAGALGLMQLMPRTGRAVAKSIGRPRPSRSALLDPDRNIELGTAYLSQLLKQFRHPVLVTASYNAGGSRARRWQPRARALAADIWIDTVPFTETRGYLKRVLSYTMVYDYRLGKTQRRLSDWMRAIPPRN